MIADKEFDLLTLGELLMRLSPPGNERLSRGDLLQKQLGGAELNVAAGVSLLGLRTGLISKLPSNLLGSFAKNQIRSCGISDAFLSYDADPDARLGIYYYEYGAHPRKPGVVYDRRHTSMYKLSLEDFPESVYNSTHCFHTSGITLALSPQIRETAVQMIKRFKEAGAVISIDVNYRANLWTGPEAKACIEQILPLTDIFFCSEDTARLTFLKTGSQGEIMQSFAAEYPLTLLASTKRTVHSPKLHSFGSVLYDPSKQQFYEEAAYENIDVIDRIGTGDAYISGVLYGLLAHGFDCRRALEYGNAAAAVKHSIPGDLPASGLDEIDRIIRDHQTKSKSEMER